MSLPPSIVSPEGASAIAAAIDAVDTALGRPPFVGPFTSLTATLTSLSELLSEHLPESEYRKARLESLVAPSSGAVSAAIKTTLPILAMAYPKGIPTDGGTVIDQGVLQLFIRCMASIADVSTIPLAELVRTGLQHLEPPTGDMVLLCARSKRMDGVTARHLLRVSDLVDEVVIISTIKGGKGADPTSKVPKGKKGAHRPSKVSTCDPSVIIALCRVALQSPDIDVAVRTDLIELLRECVFNDTSLPNALQSLLPTTNTTLSSSPTTLSFNDMNFVANLFDSIIVPNVSSPHSIVPLLEVNYAADTLVVERSLSQTCLKAVTSCITSSSSTTVPAPTSPFDSLFKSLGMMGQSTSASSGEGDGSVDRGTYEVKLHPTYLWESLSPPTAVTRIKGVLQHCLSELDSLLLQYPPATKPIMGCGALAALSTTPDVRLFPIIMGAIPALAALANVAGSSSVGGLKGLVLNPIEVTLITEMLLLAALYIPRLPQLTAAIAPPPIKSAKASKAAKASDPPPPLPIFPPLPTSLSANTFLTLSAPIFGMLWGCKFTTKLPIHSHTTTATSFKAVSIEALITNTLRVCLSRDELLLTRLLDSRVTKGDGLSLEASSELSRKVGAVLILLIELYKRVGALVSLCKGIEGGFGPITTQHPLGASIGLALSADAELASGTTLRGFTRHWLRFIMESRVVPLTAILDCANQLPFQKVLPALNASVAAARKEKVSAGGKSGKGGGKGASVAPPAAPPGSTNVIDEGAIVYASPTDKVALRRMLVRCLVFGATDHAVTATKAALETAGHDESVARLVALIGTIRSAAIGSSTRHPKIVKASLVAFTDLLGASEILSEVYAAATTASSDFLSDIVTLATSTAAGTDSSENDDVSQCARTILSNLAKVELERSRPAPPDTLRGVLTSTSSDKWPEVILYIEDLKKNLVAEGYGTNGSTQGDIAVRSQALIDALNRRRLEITNRLKTIATEKAARDRELRGKLHEQARVQEAVRAAFEARRASQEEARVIREEKRVNALLHAKDLEAKRRLRAVEKRKLQVQAARERDGLTDSLGMYLESALRLGHFEALTIVNRLRPKISHLSADDVHEYIVTGATKVPADMLARLADDEDDVLAAAAKEGDDVHASDDPTSRQAVEVRNKVRERYFAEANGEVSFWDMVERATREENGGVAAPAKAASCVTGEASRHEASKQQSLAATQDAERRAKINSMSFHYRVALFLDAFDYSTYVPERSDDPSPEWNGGVGPLTRDAVQAVFPRETAQEFGFFDAGSCAFELSQKKLLVVSKGVYTLTPIGAAYHARFAKPENSFESHRLAHLARARAALGRLPSSSSQSGMGSTEASYHHPQATEEGYTKADDKPIESDYSGSDDNDESYEEFDEDMSSEGAAAGRMFFGDELI